MRDGKTWNKLDIKMTEGSQITASTYWAQLSPINKQFIDLITAGAQAYYHAAESIRARQDEDPIVLDMMLPYLEYYKRSGDDWDKYGKQITATGVKRITSKEQRTAERIFLLSALLAPSTPIDIRTFIREEKRLVTAYCSLLTHSSAGIQLNQTSYDAENPPNLEERVSLFVEDFWNETFKQFDQSLEKCSDEEKALKIPAMLVDTFVNIESRTSDFYQSIKSNLPPAYSASGSNKGIRSLFEHLNLKKR